ncbi:MAG TPA: LL-diaminopimelate aminotransferase [Chthoniobacterales bacterium]|nr:LL-diaminopimelate aminotransferase [Chthoniobacterales bacterium]
MTAKQSFDWQTAGGTDDVMRLVDCLEREDISWCAIGGVAVNYWAREPMVTQDVDFVAATDAIERAVTALEGVGFRAERFDWSVNFTGRSKVSLQLSTEEFYRDFPKRAGAADVHGILLRVASLPDTLCGKIEAWTTPHRAKASRSKISLILRAWWKRTPNFGLSSQKNCGSKSSGRERRRFDARPRTFQTPMAYLNENYLKLQAGYLFPEIARRVQEYCTAHPEGATRLIRCGIGDVTEPLPPAAVAAMHKAVEELAHRETFRGYGHEQGYEFLRSKIAEHDYRARGIEVAADEIFLSDGSKPDCGFILDILGDQNKVAITDPVYPVYVDTNVMAGHTGVANANGRFEGIVYMPCTEENGFVPSPPTEHADLVYLCFPNNPTGAVATREQLTQWVEYAHEHHALLLYDAAYEGYIADPATPHSIYEIAGASDCAIEFHSFSKTGGFTGVRCGFTVMPKNVKAQTKDGRWLPLHPLWHRRWSTKANGVSYPVQRGAEALYSDEGRAQVRSLIEHYMGNARILREAAVQAGMRVHGGVNAPYIWVKTPDGLTSWEMFDRMLHDLNVVITPGSGFGSCGEGYFRISAFNSRANALEVARRLQTRA